MTSEELANLQFHTEHLALALIRETSPDGVIRTRLPDGSFGPDVPATHHLLEVLAALDGKVFSDGIATGTHWLMDPRNGIAGQPFALDSFALSAERTAASEALLRSGIADRQLPDGSIPVFCAYLPGGDYFSTLWSLKVLGRYSAVAFATEIEMALNYLEQRRTVGLTSRSQLGFFGLLLAQHRPERRELLRAIAEELQASLALPTEDEQQLPMIERLFLIEDLLAIDDAIGGLGAEIDRCLADVFELQGAPKGIPAPLLRTRQAYGDSLFIETLARGVMVGILRLRKAGTGTLALMVNRLVHSDYRETRYKALQSSAALREFLERYGHIHAAFQPYNSKLEEALDQHPFSRSIFLMMPFDSDLGYRKLTEVIKAACEARGYRAVRVDDPDRRFEATLWDNLIVNMLSCRFGIAIYISEPAPRIPGQEEKLFHNPNVALEFGFFKSRGQEVLLLKDKESKLPTDLQGFLWEEFSIKNPDTSVPEPLARWLDGLDRQLAAEAADG